MLRIRLLRTGRKNLSQFRIVVARKEAPIKGDFIEIVGSYNPNLDKKDGLKINKDRINYWLKVGAKPSDTVNNLLVDAEILTAKDRIKKTTAKKVKQKEEKPEKPAVIEAPATPTVQAASAMEIVPEESNKEKSPEPPAEDVNKTADKSNEQPASKTPEKLDIKKSEKEKQPQSK